MPSKDPPANPPNILSDRPIDDVPEPHAVRRGPYHDYVTKVRDTGRSREIRCADRKSMQAVYVGVDRAIKRLDVADSIIARQRAGKKHHSVIVELIDAPEGTPTDVATA